MGFEARTPANQIKGEGAHQCPWCDFWGVVTSLTDDHIKREHGGRTPRPHKEYTPADKEALRRAATEKRAAMRARQAQKGGPAS